MVVSPTSLSDTITPFLIDRSHVRGRLVRMIDTSQTILGRYPYPVHIAKELGDLLTAASMLSSNLKQDGVFTLQIKGKGAVPLMVVDAVHGGAVRGYAEVDSSITMQPDAPISAWIGDDASLAITLDPGRDMQRYQGILEVKGDSVV